MTIAITHNIDARGIDIDDVKIVARRVETQLGGVLGNGLHYGPWTVTVRGKRLSVHFTMAGYVSVSLRLEYTLPGPNGEASAYVSVRCTIDGKTVFAEEVFAGPPESAERVFDFFSALIEPPTSSFGNVGLLGSEYPGPYTQ